MFQPCVDSVKFLFRCLRLIGLSPLDPADLNNVEHHVNWLNVFYLSNYWVPDILHNLKYRAGRGRCVLSIEFFRRERFALSQARFCPLRCEGGSGERFARNVTERLWSINVGGFSLCYCNYFLQQNSTSMLPRLSCRSCFFKFRVRMLVRKARKEW